MPDWDRAAEAEAALLGQPIIMLAPEVIGFKLHGRLPEGAEARVTVETRDRAHADTIFVALDADGYAPQRIETGAAMD